MSASWIISCILPSNSLPTRSVTLSLGVNAFATFFFSIALDGCVITISERGFCTGNALPCAKDLAAPNSALSRPRFCRQL